MKIILNLLRKKLNAEFQLFLCKTRTNDHQKLKLANYAIRFRDNRFFSPYLSEAEEILKRIISLTVEEALKIQNEILHRPPTLTECILWSIQGSEHSSYKSSRKHLKQFLTTSQDVILYSGEDVGIVAVAKIMRHRYGIVMSHESHNHPSQVVPMRGRRLELAAMCAMSRVWAPR